jgi:hypothetical protein
MSDRTKLTKQHNRSTRRDRTSRSARLAWTGFLILTLGAAWYGTRLVTHKSATAIASQLQKHDIAWPARRGLAASGNQQPGARLIYPFSLVPGGIATIDELKRAIAGDPALAAHYAGFNLLNARVTLLGRDRLAYVSYRKDNRIFWTTKKVRLTKGEKVITDGVHTIRARCGNLASDGRQSPTSATEPLEAVLDNAPTPGTSPDPESFAGITQAATETVASVRPAASANQQGPGDSVLYVSPIVLSPSGGGGRSSNSPNALLPTVTPPVNPATVNPAPVNLPPVSLPPVDPATPPPVVAVPEPSTLIMLLAAVPLFWLLLRRQSRAVSTTNR